MIAGVVLDGGWWSGGERREADGQISYTYRCGIRLKPVDEDGHPLSQLDQQILAEKCHFACDPTSELVFQAGESGGEPPVALVYAAVGQWVNETLEAARERLVYQDVTAFLARSEKAPEEDEGE